MRIRLPVVLAALALRLPCRAAPAEELVLHPEGPSIRLLGSAQALSPEGAIAGARRAWTLIEGNRPSVDVQSAYASALPKEAKDWRELSGWSAPEGREYGFTARSLLGMTVVDVRYQVVRSWGGGRDGKGKYLASVAVVPLRVSVAWGYRLDMSVTVPSVTNVGTGADPVAAMILELRWRIATPLKDEEGRSSYYLRGDGVFRELDGPFPRALEAPPTGI